MIQSGLLLRLCTALVEEQVVEACIVDNMGGSSGVAIEDSHAEESNEVLDDRDVDRGSAYPSNFVGYGRFGVEAWPYVPDSRGYSVPDKQLISVENREVENDVFDKRDVGNVSRVEVERVDNDQDNLTDVERAIEAIIGSDVGDGAVDDELSSIWDRVSIDDFNKQELGNSDEVPGKDSVFYDEITNLYEQHPDYEVASPDFQEVERADFRDEDEVENSTADMDNTDSAQSLESIVERVDTSDLDNGFLFDTQHLEEEVGGGFGELFNSDFDAEVDIDEDEDLFYADPLGFLEF